MVQRIRAVALGIVVFVFDRISKVRALNEGSAQLDSTVFFIFSNSLFFSLILFLLLISVAFFAMRYTVIRLSPLGPYALTLTLFGGAGNLIDRFFLAGIINPFSFAGLSYNVADVALLIGGGILIALCFQKSTRER